MEKLIGKIIEIEDTAQSITREARDKQEGFNREMKAEIESMRADFDERAKHRVEIVAEAEQQSLVERMAELEGEHTRKSQWLEQQCVRNFDGWVDELMAALKTP